ncbi:MAG: hypothetical protein VKJ86_01655 [Synechococcus sp.]|nr:hypothetical protein [Synechococcus sp.]
MKETVRVVHIEKYCPNPANRYCRHCGEILRRDAPFYLHGDDLIGACCIKQRNIHDRQAAAWQNQLPHPAPYDDRD